MRFANVFGTVWAIANVPYKLGDSGASSSGLAV